MTKDAFEIKIHSVIDNLDDLGTPDSDPEINITTLKGTADISDGTGTLKYTEENEGQKIYTDITVLPDGRVELKRRGALVSDMIFSENEATKTIYEIPPYKFDMLIETKKIRNSLSAGGGELQLIYSMEVGGSRKNARMKITLSPCK